MQPPPDDDGTAPHPPLVAVGGDGIGPEVVASALTVMRAAGYTGTIVEVAAGWDHWIATGVAIDDATVSLVAEHGLCLFGATTSQPESVTRDLRDGRDPWVSPILELRRRLDLDVSVRPIRSFPGVEGAAVWRSDDGRAVACEVDLVIVRQNTEGLYAGVEWRRPPPDVAAALATHPRWSVPPHEDVAVSVRVVTRTATERVVRAACDMAVLRQEDRLVVAEKPNVLRATSGMVVEVAEQVVAEYPGLAMEPLNVDAVLMEMTARPGRFGVIVTTNLFGDLLSDAAAGLVGGPGFAPSANLGTTSAVFEPVHGSAPDITGTGMANPVATILAAAMLADHAELGFGSQIRSAVAAAIAQGLPENTAEITSAVVRLLG